MERHMEPYVRYAAESTYYIRRTVVASDCRLLYLLAGQGRFVCGETAFPLLPHTLLYYPYGVPYRIEGEGDAPLRFYTINFDFSHEAAGRPVLIPREPQEHDRAEEVRSLPQDLHPVFSHCLCLPDAYFAQDHLHSIVQEGLEQQEGYAAAQGACLHLLLIHLLRHLHAGHPADTLCARIKEWVQKEPGLQNKDIAARMNYHPYYLGKIFKAQEGISLHQYMIGQRLARAHQRITTTSAPLSEIAQACGFSSLSHFSDAFKRRYGIPPGHLRRGV